MEEHHPIPESVQIGLDLDAGPDSKQHCDQNTGQDLSPNRYEDADQAKEAWLAQKSDQVACGNADEDVDKDADEDADEEAHEDIHGNVCEEAVQGTTQQPEDSSAAHASGANSSTDVPVETLNVVRWSRKPVFQEEQPEHLTWLIHSKTVPGRDARVCTTPDIQTELQSAHRQAYDDHLCTITSNRTSFRKGRVMLDSSVPIKTCGGQERPRVLWRAVHDGMPHGGIGARSLGLVETDGIFFQRFLQNHLVWICRQPSPFISVANKRDKALSMAAAFAARGRTGIRILEISSVGEHWEHGQSRLWDVMALLASFHLEQKIFYEHEYLVERSIPSQHIIKSYDWDFVLKHWANAQDEAMKQECVYANQKADYQRKKRKKAEEKAEEKRKREEEVNVTDEHEQPEREVKRRCNLYNAVIAGKQGDGS
jgi:hypothetical protein